MPNIYMVVRLTNYFKNFELSTSDSTFQLVSSWFGLFFKFSLNFSEIWSEFYLLARRGVVKNVV